MLALAACLFAGPARAVSLAADPRVLLHQQVENLRAALPLSLQPEIEKMTPAYRARFSDAELEGLKQAYANETAVLIQLSVATDRPMRADYLDLAQRQFSRSKGRLLSLLYQVCASRFPDGSGQFGTDGSIAAFEAAMQRKLALAAEIRELLRSKALAPELDSRLEGLKQSLAGVPDGSVFDAVAAGLEGARADAAKSNPALFDNARRRAEALTLSPSDFKVRVSLRPEPSSEPPPPQEIAAVLRSRGATDAMIKATMAASQRQSLDPLLIGAFMSSESTFDPRARNEKSGASGLMQLMPETAAGWGVKDIYSIQQNVLAGARHLTYLEALIAANGADFDKDDLRTARRFALGKLPAERMAEIRAKIDATFAELKNVFERARPLVQDRLAALVTEAEQKAQALAAAKRWSPERARRAVASAVAKARDEAVLAVFSESVYGRISDRVKWIIGAYNAGEGRISQYGGLPPFKETRRYVPRVLLRYFTNYLLAAQNALGVASFGVSPELDPRI